MQTITTVGLDIAKSVFQVYCVDANGATKAPKSVCGFARNRARLLSRRSKRGCVTGVLSAPIDYMLRRWGRFVRFLDDGRICLTNNAAERALRGFALGRKSWLFAGSERGADRAAAIVTMITTAKLNDVDPQAWLADVLARIADHTIQNLDQFLPWNWKPSAAKLAA
jgi:transposase